MSQTGGQTGSKTGAQASAEIVVCVGPGGVGKTTTAAAIALEWGAIRRACLRGHDRPRPQAGGRPRHKRRG